MDSPLNIQTKEDLPGDGTADTGRIGVSPTEPDNPAPQRHAPTDVPLTTHVEGTSSNAGHLSLPKIKDNM